MTLSITLKMKTAAEIQAIIDALPPVNNLDLSTNKATQALQRLNALAAAGGRIYLQDLGIREVGYARRRAVVGQALYMEPWDGVSGIIDISDFLLRIAGAAAGHAPVSDPIKGLNLFLREQASDVNFGRIRLIETDEVRTSIERGMIKLLLDLGIMEIEADDAQDLQAALIAMGGVAGAGDLNELATNLAGFIGAEALQLVTLDELLVASTATDVDMVAAIPAGAIILSVQANNQTAITLGGGATAHAVGIAGTLDKYIDDSALAALNDKLGGLIGGFTALAAPETLRWASTNGSAVATGTIDGTLRVVVKYLIPTDLADV